MNWQHNPIGERTHSPAAASDPACFAWEQDETQHVVYRGKDNDIHEIWQRRGQDWKNGGALNERAHGPEADGQPFGYAWSDDDTQHILYRGTDNQVHELWQRPGQGWQHGGALSHAAGGPPASSDPYGYVWVADRTQHVVYRGNDNHIHELWQRLGQHWAHGGVLSRDTHAPLAAGNPVGLAWEKDGTQHLIYRGADDHIHELFQKRGHGWEYGGALSKNTGAPAAASDPAFYVWEKDESQHIVYRGRDGQIHELWYRHMGGWKYGGALSALTHAPLAASAPFGYVWDDDDTQHVVYSGTDDHIHELWQRRGQGWDYGGALSKTAGGPPAGGNPMGFAWAGDKSQHIVYRGADGRIHELWQKK
jgi:hypothetical protein